MSAFLGHIHYWLYKKIQLLVERENLILEKTRRVVDDLADELHEISIDTYGAPIDAATPLEDIIDHNNIHGWLSGQINVASVREAAFIKDMLDTNSGDDAVLVVAAILDAFAVQGKACGTVAKENLEDVNAPSIYNALQNFYVNGMPCDGGDQIVEDTADTFTWVGDHKLQSPYWRTAGVDPQFMQLAYQTWFEAFVKEVAPGFELLTTDDGAQRLYTIQRV
ncbi:hypothetical protein [Veillonella caviae]|uniref:hypothetical protein n=1 Tax=Veillonella caviae TaxID=248316 RepID=UPI0023A7B643|nr:hypothetical protein [Veillonella caviae]MCI5708624.1 hypothetical protein [Veillonella caviae]MDY5714731.1 hypothetical protein [Veillonella caviae]